MHANNIIIIANTNNQTTKTSLIKCVIKIIIFYKFHLLSTHTVLNVIENKIIIVVAVCPICLRAIKGSTYLAQKVLRLTDVIFYNIDTGLTKKINTRMIKILLTDHFLHQIHAINDVVFFLNDHPYLQLVRFKFIISKEGSGYIATIR